MKSSAPVARRSRLPVGLSVGVGLALLVLSIAAVDVYRDLAQQKQRRIELEQRIQASELRIRELEARIERMRNDSDTLEQLAREELGLVRPEDVLVIFPESSSDADSERSGETGSNSQDLPD